MIRSKLIQFSYIILSTAFLTGCVKEEKQVVPDVYVDFYINLDLPDYNTLNSPNIAKKVSNQGYDKNGVIVYRYSLDEFYAFDATCPQHIEKSTSVTLDQNGAAGTATCSYCNTKYYLITKGTSNGYPLKSYRTLFSGRIVHIFN